MKFTSDPFLIHFWEQSGGSPRYLTQHCPVALRPCLRREHKTRGGVEPVPGSAELAPESNIVCPCNKPGLEWLRGSIDQFILLPGKGSWDLVLLFLRMPELARAGY